MRGRIIFLPLYHPVSMGDWKNLTGGGGPTNKRRWVDPLPYCHPSDDEGNAGKALLLPRCCRIRLRTTREDGGVLVPSSSSSVPPSLSGGGDRGIASCLLTLLATSFCVMTDSQKEATSGFR